MGAILIFSSILEIAIRSGTSLLYVTLGEIIAERSGVMNLGIEGMLLSCAVVSFAVGYHTGDLFVGVLAGLLIGAILGGIFALLTVYFQADQIVAGLSLFIFGSGLASFLGQRLGPGNSTLVGLIGPKFPRISIPVLSDIPILGNVLFTQDLLTYILYFLTPAISYLLYRTRIGLNIRSVGENPETADALGINVKTLRFLSLVVGGMLVGVGGAHISLGYSPGWTENITGGRGWIAIAMVIFATWDPARALFGALLFGGISALQFRLQAEGSSIPSAYLRMIPYLFTLIVLIVINSPSISKKKFGAPEALGTNYMRESSE